MELKKKIQIFSHWDMDGAASILCLKWLFGNRYDIEYICTTAKKFRKTFNDWLITHKISDYIKIFICDLDVSESQDIVDNENIFIIDHHKSHLKANYTKCKYIIREDESACKIIANDLLKNKLTNLQKVLVKLVTDYDCFKLKYPISRQMNILFWSTKQSIQYFITKYNNGFVPFNKFELDTIKKYENVLDSAKKNMKIFERQWVINNIKYNCCAVQATSMIDDIAQYLLTKSYDIVFIINIKTMSVSVRKNNNVTLSLSEFCSKYGGGGHEYAGGLSLSNENFANELKEFKLHENRI